MVLNNKRSNIFAAKGDNMKWLKLVHAMAASGNGFSDKPKCKRDVVRWIVNISRLI